MSRRSVIPFGPQHPVLPEPIHLDLVIEDEIVVEAIPSIGYVHRGLEKLAETRDYIDYVYVAERVCGICSFMHGMGYSMAVEDIMKLELPPRAMYLRVIWAELSRIHSHLLWMGLLADAFGFENLFMQCWRQREKILDIFEMTTGGRVIFSVCKVGGVRKDMDEDSLKIILKTLDEVGGELKEIETTFLTDKSVVYRLKGIGVLTADEALSLGAVGPMLRASGVGQDMRLTGYAAYGELDVPVVTSPDGDSFARCEVRMKEIHASIEIIRQAIARIPDGEIAVNVKGTPNGQSFIRLEQPRGEAFYHVRANGSKFLERFRVRTPTFANLPALLKILEGRSLANVPVLILTIDPCISCTER